MIKKYMTSEEAAHYLGVPLTTFYNMRVKGMIPCHRLGGVGRPKFVAEELDALMQTEEKAEEILNKNSVGA